jgi:cellobiose-specific phosphotransferase system component IIC
MRSTVETPGAHLADLYMECCEYPASQLTDSCPEVMGSWGVSDVLWFLGYQV